ncbi:DnaA-like protein [Sulfolobus spindle-shaped virus]|nr:DnaA-like protein [Sulfolobus spindle-shaped virus]
MKKLSEIRKGASLILAREIVSAYKNNGFTNILIFGKQGVGKTTYALRVAKEVVKMLDNDITEEEAWSKALSYLVFTLEEAIQKMKAVVELHKQGNINARLPLLILDDASIDLIKYKWYDETNQEFYKLNVLARTWVASLIYTTPMVSDIAKFLREKGWIVVKITKGGNKNTSLAYLYKRAFALNSTKTDFVGKYKVIAIDYFTRRMPNSIYNEYMQRRDKVMISIAEKILNVDLNSEEKSLNV